MISVDVGGTKIAVGDVDPISGHVRYRQVVPTRAERGVRAVLDDIVNLVDITLQRIDRRSDDPSRSSRRPIGVSVAELVGLEGEVTSAHTIPLKSAQLVSALGPFGDVVVCSDVRVAALAEARLGAGRNYASFVYVSVGTGLSSTFVIDGVPFPGANGNAILAGSGTMIYDCEACGARGQHIPEKIASGAGLVDAYSDLTGRKVEGALDIVELADNGDGVARAVIRRGGDVLGNVLATLVNLLDPGAIIVGGGLGSAQGMFRATWERSLRAHIWAESSRAVPALAAALGSDSALVGAALAAGDHDVA